MMKQQQSLMLLMLPAQQVQHRHRKRKYHYRQQQKRRRQRQQSNPMTTLITVPMLLLLQILLLVQVAVVTVMAAPYFLSDDRIRDLDITPSLGRGYSVMTNEFQSTCLKLDVTSVPAFNYERKFKFKKRKRFVHASIQVY